VRNVVLTTSPDVQNVSNVTLLKVMVEVVVVGTGLPVEDLGLQTVVMEVVEVAAVVATRKEMVSGIAQAVVSTTSPDVQSVSSVMSPKEEQVVVEDVVRREVETETEGTSVDLPQRRGRVIGSVRVVTGITSLATLIASSVTSPNRF